MKKATEHPQRVWKIFLLDTLKQALGQTLIHFINLYLSIFMNSGSSSYGSAGNVKADECTWYFNTFLVDLFPGLVIIMISSAFVDRLFIKLKIKTMVSGNYAYEENDELIINYTAYGLQLLLWISILLLSKTIVFGLQIFFKPFLASIGTFCLSIFNFSNDFKLFFVMILFPLVANVVFFWISDNLLKKHIWFEEDQSLKRSFYEPENFSSVSEVIHFDSGSKKQIKASLANRRRSNL